MEITITINTDNVEDIKVKVEKPKDDIYYVSQYGRVFDIDNVFQWEHNNMKNKSFLLQMQNYFNMKLQMEGKVYLNDVYEALGFNRVEAYERRVGWVYNTSNPVGDNYIDFGLYDPTMPEINRCYHGGVRPIVLDFNVDGDILKYL